MAGTNFLRVAFRFRQYDNAWWEVYGSARSSITDALNDAANVRTEIVSFRHPSVYVSHVRASNPFAPRQAEIRHFTVPDRAPGASPEPDVTSTAAIYEFAGSDAGVKRHVWFRGLNDRDVERRSSTGADLPSGALTGGVQALFDALRANNFGIPNVVPVDAGDNKRHTITTITVLPLGFVKLTSADAFTLNSDKRVILYQINQKFFPGLTGRFTVTSDASAIYPKGYVTPLPEGEYPQQTGAFRNETWRFSSFRAAGATFLHFDRRDTAGGPLATRGRSRAVIRRSR